MFVLFRRTYWREIYKLWDIQSTAGKRAQNRQTVREKTKFVGTYRRHLREVIAGKRVIDTRCLNLYRRNL